MMTGALVTVLFDRGKGDGMQAFKATINVMETDQFCVYVKSPTPTGPFGNLWYAFADEGVTWARGWRDGAGEALRAAFTLADDGTRIPPGVVEGRGWPEDDSGIKGW